MARSDRWKNRQLLYKRADILGAGDTSDLQSHLELARQALGLVPWRTECVDGEDTHRVLTSLHQVGPLLMGALIEYTRGASPVGFTLDEHATEIALEQLMQLEEGQEVVAGALHFGVAGHHVVIMPSSTVRASDCEKHLNWFLSRTQALPDGAAVILRDELAPEVRQRWQGVTGMTLRSPLNAHILEETEEIPNRLGPASLGQLLRRTVPGFKDLVGQLNAGQLESLEKLDVKLEIRFAGRSERLDTTILDHVLATLPDDDWSSVSLNVRGVGSITAGQIRVAAKRSITHEKGIPVVSSVADRMQEWLYSLVETGRVRG